MFGEISNYLGEKIEYEVSDLFAYFNIIKKIKKNATLIYRGECQKYPSINGSIFREYNVKDIKIGLFKYQDLIIKEFYQEMASSIKDLDRQNFLAYSQHHGLPTSLIDVTHSPLVSLYFACCQGKDEDGYVYIFKRNDTINISEMIIINPYLNGDDLLYEHNEKFIVFVMNEIYESSFFPVEELLINLIEFIKNDSITPAYENSYSRIVRPLIKNTDLQTDNVRLLAEQWIHIFENDEGITSNLLSFLEKLKENKLFVILFSDKRKDTIMLFTKQSFDAFALETLEERMEKIRSEIQPVFQTIGEAAIPLFEESCQEPFYLHIAQHRRRTVYPPAETWAGIGPNKRGYKMDAHFQIGINQAYVFVWLSVIDQPKNQATIAESWLAQKELFDQLPADFTLSPDHTKYDHSPIAKWPTYLERLQKVKKSELQIGKIFPKEMIEDVEMADILAVYQTLLPLYHARLSALKEEQ